MTFIDVFQTSHFALTLNALLWTREEQLHEIHIGTLKHRRIGTLRTRNADYIKTRNTFALHLSSPEARLIWKRIMSCSWRTHSDSMWIFPTSLDVGSSEGWAHIRVPPTAKTSSRFSCISACPVAARIAKCIMWLTWRLRWWLRCSWGLHSQ